MSDNEKEIIYGGAWPLHRDMSEYCAHIDIIFTAEECSKIIEIGENLFVQKALTSRNEEINEKIRDSYISFIWPNQNTAWIFERLTSGINFLNSKFFNFDLQYFGEGLQFTKYTEPNGHYKCHIDRFKGEQARKLSISIQLNDSSEFEGGDLMLHYSSNALKVPMKQGKMFAFPSYALHEVTPVTRGTRYSLVAWISGPPFR